MKNLEEIKQQLKDLKEILIQKYHISEIGIFGSYIRNEQDKDSDLDILVEFAEIPSLLKFINLKNYLTNYLEIKVDLVHKSGLKPKIGERILTEVIYL